MRWLLAAVVIFTLPVNVAGSHAKVGPHGPSVGDLCFDFGAIGFNAAVNRSKKLTFQETLVAAMQSEQYHRVVQVIDINSIELSIRMIHSSQMTPIEGMVHNISSCHVTFTDGCNHGI